MSETIRNVIVADGLQSPEGPSFDRQGILHFVDWDAQKIFQLKADGETCEFVHTGGIPTGSKFHSNGHLFVADGDLGILDISPDGKIKIAASEWDGKKFKGPNDLVFSNNGDLYFSDPRGSDPQNPIGNVFILRANGKVERFAGDFQFPNGLVFSDDGRTLYLAETFPNHILAFEIDEQGYEKSRRVFAKLEGGLGPDGMAFGQDGNLYVAHFGKGAIAVINPEGQVIQEFKVGAQNPTNVAFGDDGLYVTEVEKGQIVRISMDVQGQLLFGQK
ncbi:MAG: SMP-30/gluconolactonase/LRE family protein [Anaerolineaceae bacterium]|nr:SMP-30/gluconolactonase/LRE family protein [Anaerolineaceae bacterium]